MGCISAGIEDTAVMNWDDLRVVRAIYQTGSYAAAARELAINETTVPRRLARLERDLGVRLFDARDGQRRPTAHCEEIVALSASMAGDAERIAADGIEVVALQCLSRCERDGMHENVERIPTLCELGDGGIDLLVELHVAWHGDVGIELRRELLDAASEALVLIGESHLGAVLVHGLGDPPGDGAVPRNTDDEGPFAVEKSHRESPQVPVRIQAGSVPEST